MTLDTPLKIDMEPKNHPLKRKIIFQTSVIVFHVNFSGCIQFFEFPIPYYTPNKLMGTPSVISFELVVPGGLEQEVGSTETALVWRGLSRCRCQELPNLSKPPVFCWISGN